MTHAECVAALTPLDRRIYLLALVSQIWERCVTECADDALLAVVWALDATRRWCLGEADVEEVRASAYAAYSAYSAYSAYAAAYAAYAAYAAHADTAYAAYAAYAADADTAYGRERLVKSIAGVEWGAAVTTPSGWVVTPTHLWVPEGQPGGQWVARSVATPEQLVGADLALEAA